MTDGALSYPDFAALALLLSGFGWVLAVFAISGRLRAFDRMRIPYRFASEVERRVQRRFSDAHRTSAPFVSELGRIFEASRDYIARGGEDSRAKKFSKRFEKLNGASSLQLFERSLLGNTDAWRSGNEAPAVASLVQNAFLENPLLQRVGKTSMSLLQRATDAMPSILAMFGAVGSALAATLLFSAFQNVSGGQGVPSKELAEALAMLLLPGAFAAVQVLGILLLNRFYNPERMFARTQQKLSGSIEVLWKDLGSVTRPAEPALEEIPDDEEEPTVADATRQQAPPVQSLQPLSITPEASAPAQSNDSLTELTNDDSFQYGSAMPREEDIPVAMPDYGAIPPASTMPERSINSLEDLNDEGSGSSKLYAVRSTNLPAVIPQPENRVPAAAPQIFTPATEDPFRPFVEEEPGEVTKEANLADFEVPAATELTPIQYVGADEEAKRPREELTREMPSLASVPFDGSAVPEKSAPVSPISLAPPPPAPAPSAPPKPTVIRRTAPTPTFPISAPAAPSAGGGNLWGSTSAPEAPATTSPSSSDEDRGAVLRHRLTILEQYLKKAETDRASGVINEAMYKEEVERWALEREKITREMAQLAARRHTPT